MSEQNNGASPLVPYGADAAELANAWCWNCQRRKYGTCADYSPDIALLFQGLLDRGFIKDELMAETQKQSGLPPEKRDRAEYFWQFKRRVEFQKFGDQKAKGKPAETPEQLEAKRQRQIQERLQAQREREQFAAERQQRRG
jgi:hypothetical protein